LGVVVEIIFLFGHWLIQTMQPVLEPLCFFLAWVIVLLSLYSICTMICDGVIRAKVMHQIPCANCQFFTGDYRLKCPVHPTRALTEAAIHCPDHEPTKNLIG
jgi:hypothetical protein